MDKRQRLTEKAKETWDEMLRTDFDFDFMLGEYDTTKASAEQDAEHMLEGENGIGYRSQIFENFKNEEIGFIDIDSLKAYMQEALVVELKKRLPAY